MQSIVSLEKLENSSYKKYYTGIWQAVLMETTDKSLMIPFKNLTDRCWQKWFLFSIYSLCSLLGAVACLFFVMEASGGRTSGFAIAAMAPPVALIFVLGIKLTLDNRDNASFVFLIVATPILCGFCFLMLPDKVPDEIWHIYRVLNFTGSGAGGMVAPDSLTYLKTPSTYHELSAALAAAPDWSSIHIVERDMSSYLSHLYALPGVVAFVGEAMNLNPFIVVFMARMTNACLFLVSGFWILRIIPLGKTVAFVYLLNPMLLQQEASCSADAFLNVIALLFVAYFLKVVYQDNVTRKEGAILVILLLVTCLSKFAYAPLALLLLFLVPKLVYQKKIRATIYITVAAICSVAIVFVLFVYNGSAFKDALDLVRSPFEFVAVILRSIFFMGPFWLASFGGGNLGPLTINAWAPCLWGYFIMLSVALFYNLGEERSATRGQKVFIGLLVSAMVVLIILVFREWTINVDKRSDIIMGVQGRYFIPIFLLPLLCLVGPKTSIQRHNCLLGYSTALMLIILCDLAMVVRYFW